MIQLRSDYCILRNLFTVPTAIFSFLYSPAIVSSIMYLKWVLDQIAACPDAKCRTQYGIPLQFALCILVCVCGLYLYVWFYMSIARTYKNRKVIYDFSNGKLNYFKPYAILPYRSESLGNIAKAEYSETNVQKFFRLGDLTLYRLNGPSIKIRDIKTPEPACYEVNLLLRGEVKPKYKKIIK